MTALSEQDFEKRIQTRKRLIIFVQPFGAAYSSVVESLMNQSGVRLTSSSSLLEAGHLALRAESCLIVCQVDNEDRFRRLLTMGQVLIRAIREKKVRLLVSTSYLVESKQKKLALLYNAEVVMEPTQEKNLLFKINRQLQGIPLSRTVAIDPEKANVSRQGSTSQSGVPVVRSGESLTLESDCWQSTLDTPRNLSGKWLIELKGPSPNSGHWVQTEAKIAGSEAWEWTPFDPEHDPYIHEAGAWIFHGEKPRAWEGVWIFEGRDPDLSFYYDGDNYGSKIAADYNQDNFGGIVIARDSETARRLQSAAPPVAQAKRPTFLWADPLGIESDCWLVRNRAPSRLFNKWVIPLLGPAPVTGRWLPGMPGDSGSKLQVEAKEGIWHWVPKDPDRDPFIREQGDWIFQGYQPKYSDGIWTFSGSRPDLSFFYQGESYGDKLKTHPDGLLVIARDSENSEDLLPQIEASSSNWVAIKNQPDSPADVNESAREPGFLAEWKRGQVSGPEPEPFLVEHAGVENSAASSFVPIDADSPSFGGREDARFPLDGPEALRASVGESQSEQGALSPLALAFLMSELMRGRQLDRKEIGRRFCEYLGASMGGARVELWVRSRNRWFCGGSTDGTHGRLGGRLSENPTLRLGVDLDGVIVAPVLARELPGVPLLGALLIETVEPEKVSLRTVSTAARISLGLLMTLSGHLKN